MGNLTLQEFFNVRTEVVYDSENSDNSGSSGKLIMGDRDIPIVDGISRFVEKNNYANNFSIQWNEFKKTQYDSYTGMTFTADRFWQNTKWS